MPKQKLKSHSGAKKRIGMTGRGKFMRPKGNQSHLRTRRSNRAKGLYDEMLPVSPSAVKMLKRVLPYGVR